MTLAPVTLPSLAKATLHVAIFLAALLLAAKYLPGPTREGLPQPDGSRQRYRVNGLATWLTLHLVLGLGTTTFGLRLSPLVWGFWSYLVVANAVAIGWAVALFVGGRRRARAAKRGAGAALRDFWMGVELNPTLWGIDLKTWAYQPSLLGLELLNLGFAYAQYDRLGTLTAQMIAYQGFWWLYLTTHYWFEAGIFSMWDVIAEKFGLMLAWGDLVLVPFFYCIAGWTLLQRDESTAWTSLAPVVALHLLGLWIFRGANDQKNRFKRDRNAKIWGKPAEALDGKLLVSGFWGLGRKLNYTGEILVYLSLAACTGLRSPWPYLLPAWLAALLVHRAWRDEQRCRQKYQDLWTAYCARARFRMLPFIY